MTVYFVFQVLYNKGCIGVYVASGKCVCAIIQEYTKDVLDEGGLGKRGEEKESLNVQVNQGSTMCSGYQS